MKQVFKKIIATILAYEARAVLRKYAPRVVAITGSVGKTSTKDAIYTVLASRAYARKSQKSFNSEIGLPLTILGRPNAWSNPLGWIENIIDGLFLVLVRTRYPEWLVLEVGADRPGDIQSVAKWLPVDVAVITRLPELPVHVEFFESAEAVAEEKASLITALKQEGALVLYADDERLRSFAHKATGKKIVTFGLGESADVYIEAPQALYETGTHTRPIGMKAQLVVFGESAEVELLGAFGAHALLPLVAAAAVGNVLGKSLSETLQALRAYDPPPGRMHLIPGIKNTTIIDDTYNSSPAAVIAALDALAAAGTGRAAQSRGITPGRRIAVLGDMLELGRYSSAEHKKMGTYAAQKADVLITIGLRARDMVGAALDAGMKDGAVLQYDDARRAGAELQNMLKAGDNILIKGSQGMRMERVVEEIMAEPERAKELLVRQDAQWRKR